VDWSLLACGRFGHLTFAPDEADLRAEMAATVPDGQLWRCLRCGSFVPAPPSLSGPVAAAPVVLRGTEIRSKFILRLFAIERYLRAIVVAAAAFGLWKYRNARGSIEQTFDRELPLIRDLFRQLGFNIDHSKLFGLLQHALTLSGHTLTLLSIGLAAYAAVAIVEGTGLWLAQRWGEYFAMIVTSLGLPLEIYDLTRKVTVLTLVLLALNLILVVYLVITKRLFGVRGGKRAYHARLRSESILEKAEQAAARRRAQPEHQSAGGAGAARAAPAAAAERRPAARPAHSASALQAAAHETANLPAASGQPGPANRR
jgi:uncharacterized membrane protein (DUF2068 family)